MPSTATITAFYSFAANKKARANYVNTNFSNYRGHIIAIDPNTATSATTETYDLGSTEYRWRTGYFREIDFKSNTTTGQALQIVGDTASGNGAFITKVGSNIRSRLGNGAQYFDGDTNTTYDFRVNGTSILKTGAGNGSLDMDTTTSQFDFKFAGSTVGSFKNTGFLRSGIQKPVITTVGANTSATFNITATNTLIGTIAITAYGNYHLIGSSLLDGTNQMIFYRTVAGGPSSAFLTVYRDNTATAIGTLEFFSSRSTTTASVTYDRVVGGVIDTSCTAGAHTYYVYVQGSVNGSLEGSNLTKFTCMEI